jgi:DNA-binding transcriptional ArsR family regulator
MDDREKRFAQAAILCRLLIELVRTTAITVSIDDVFDLCCGDVLMLSAAFIGQQQGKPMTASKISSYLGLPRPTVVRRLALLLEQGFMTQDEKKRWLLNFDDHVMAKKAFDVRAAHLRHINRAMRDLSKLDT